MNQILLTRSGYEKLSVECDRLRTARVRAAEHVGRSLEFGGMAAENGEYLDARQDLDRIDLRLAALEGRLADAEIVAARRDAEVDIGRSVIVSDVESGDVSEYRIVGTGEGDPSAGAVSHRSPVGRALLGRGKGEVVQVEAPGGRRRLAIVELGG